jgi:hypothetical protein
VSVAVGANVDFSDRLRQIGNTVTVAVEATIDFWRQMGYKVNMEYGDSCRSI